MCCSKLTYGTGREGALKKSPLKILGALEKKNDSPNFCIDYYPFGLSFNSWKRPGETEQKFLYNGKELQTDLELGWYDYGARMQDPALGRFFTQDRFAEKYYDLNPYHYGANNPLFYIDVNGDSIVNISRNKNTIVVENSPAEEGGENFTKTITLAKGVKQSNVQDGTVSVVNDAMIAAEDDAVTITSGKRTGKDQARVMKHNIDKYGEQSQLDLYGPNGDKVIDAYSEACGQGCSSEEILSVMEYTVQDIGASKVSKHASDNPSIDVIDIATSTVSNPKKFHNSLKNNPAVKKLLTPLNSKDPAFHVEVKN